MLKNLTQTPTKSDKYLQADYIELLCLVNQDREISQNDVYDRFTEERDFVPNDIDNFAPDIADDNEIGDEGVPGILEFEMPLDDRRNLGIQDLFQHLRSRAEILGPAYPFEFDEDGTVLRRKNVLSDLNKLYVFLLICASLRNVEHRRDQNTFSAAFEVVSAAALKRYLPNTATVRLFGKSRMNIDGYRGTLFAKAQNLAADIKESIVCDERQFRRGNSGDGGLDIVAWLPFTDQASSLLLIFAQCAATLDWVDKQLTSGYDSWSSYMSFTNYPTNMVFIPYFFRHSDGQWYSTVQIRKTVLMDRVRILNLLADVPNPLESVPQEVRRLIDRIIEFREPIV